MLKEKSLVTSEIWIHRERKLRIKDNKAIINSCSFISICCFDLNTAINRMRRSRKNIKEEVQIKG